LKNATKKWKGVLTRSIPHLTLDFVRIAVRALHSDGTRSKLGADGGFGFVEELVLRETGQDICLSHTRVTPHDNLEKGRRKKIMDKKRHEYV